MLFNSNFVYPLLKTHANLTHLRKKDKTGYFTFASAEQWTINMQECFINRNTIMDKQYTAKYK